MNVEDLTDEVHWEKEKRDDCSNVVGLDRACVRRPGREETASAAATSLMSTRLSHANKEERRRGGEKRRGES